MCEKDVFSNSGIYLICSRMCSGGDISKSDSDIAHREAILYSMFEPGSNRVLLGSKSELNSSRYYKMPEVEALQIDVSKEITKLRNEEFIKGISYTPNPKQELIVICHNVCS